LRSTGVTLLFVLVGLGISGCGAASRAGRLDATALTAATTVIVPSPEAPTRPTPEAPTPPTVVSTTPPAAATDVSAEEATPPATVDEASDAVAITDDRFDEMVSVLLAQSAPTLKDEDAIEEEYDPWEKFNEKTFELNRRMDRYVLKPVAKAYDKVMPDRVQNMISNGFDNLRWVPRFVNSLLQAKWNGAGRELGRFLINSTLGIGGLFDIAKQEFGLEKSREDFGQTLGVWGARPGPYLILPLLPPLTVRDAIGFAVDGAMNPLNYVLPLVWDRFAMQAGDAVNDRSLNLELYQGFEETVIDMYSAVRHGYLQRREQLIKE
jgi:phospholipid-binding lipoprotein MlaA